MARGAGRFGLAAAVALGAAALLQGCGGGEEGKANLEDQQIYNARGYKIAVQYKHGNAKFTLAPAMSSGGTEVIPSDLFVTVWKASLPSGFPPEKVAFASWAATGQTQNVKNQWATLKAAMHCTLFPRKKIFYKAVPSLGAAPQLSKESQTTETFNLRDAPRNGTTGLEAPRGVDAPGSGNLRATSARQAEGAFEQIPKGQV